MSAEIQLENCDWSMMEVRPTASWP